MSHGSSAAHTELVNQVLLKIGGLPYVRVWKRVVGLFYRVRFDEAGKVSNAIAVTVGIKGEPDIDGILKRWDGVGVRVGIECKTGNAIQNPDQKKYQRIIESMGGIYILAHSPEHALTVIERERLRGHP